MKKVLVVMAILALSAFALHAVYFHHAHPAEFFGTGMQVVLHGESRKFLAFALIALFVFLIFARIALFGLFQTVFVSYILGLFSFNQNSLFRELLRTGILHPKLYR